MFTKKTRWDITYLSGPISLCKDKNTWTGNFQKYEDILPESGYEAINPVKNLFQHTINTLKHEQMKENHKKRILQCTAFAALLGVCILDDEGVMQDIKEGIGVENNKEVKYTPPSYIGTFEFEGGIYSWSLTLKEDGTGTLIRSVKQVNLSDTHYISYECYGGYLWCDISGNGVEICFDGMRDECMGYFIIDIDELYIYDDKSAYDAKNPQLRLKMKKI